MHRHDLQNKQSFTNSKRNASIEIMLSYAMSMLGTPYLWGGNSIMQGVDCSGFVTECLRSIGIIGDIDYSSQSLYDLLRNMPYRSKLKKGSVLFFGTTRNNISHVAIALNSDLMIESGGGDKSTRKFFDAVNMNAMVRIRPIRKDLVACIYPIKEDVNGNI